MNKLLLIPMFVFSLLGVLFSTILIHEYYHVLKSKNVSSLCLDFNQETIAHVDIEKNENEDVNEEKKAMFISYLYGLIGTSLITVGFMKWWKNE
jgi:hypothetical protein